MAILASDQSTAGFREDILNEIQMVSPNDTPVYSRLGDLSASSTVYEWVEDTLSTATASAVNEGASAAPSSTVSKARKSNVMQIIRKTGIVTGTTTALNTIGGRSELSHDQMTTMMEWKIEAEQQLMWGVQAAGDSSAGTGREMNGLNAAITTNRVTGSAGTVALSETVFLDQLQSIWQNGGGADAQFIVYCGGFNKRRISAFSTNNQRNVSVEDKVLKNAVSIYDGDFGVVTVALHRYTGAHNMFLIDSNKFKKAWLRKPFTEPLAKDGDRDRYHIVGELTLVHLNERSGSVFSAFASATS